MNIRKLWWPSCKFDVDPEYLSGCRSRWLPKFEPPVISRFQSNSNVLYLINCGNKSKCFLSFISFIVVTQHRVPVSCTSSYTPKISTDAAYAAQYKLLSSFTNSFKAVPHMLSSVLTDAMQMLPSAVNSHTESNKYQYMFVENLYKTCLSFKTKFI